ncbi:MAG: putative acyltransferase [Phycisphaerales bacterium]|nr:putative acyltransferase [Phycisphaerales bacterium]MDB5303996.1 putative acyltransferase [Phycisphaerales bacterium]
MQPVTDHFDALDAQRSTTLARSAGVDTLAAPRTATEITDVALRPRQRIGGLDALRGIAALGVLLYHYTSNYQRLFGHRGQPLFSLHWGALGVQLFFIISGFVIFMTLEKTRRPIDFVRSRFARLFPVYWAAIALTLVVLTLFPLAGRHVSPARALVNLTMCQELFGVGHIDPVYWTLQLELCFYAIMLVLFGAGQLRRAEWYLLALVALCELKSYWLPASGPLMMNHPALARVMGRLETLLVLDHIHVFLIGIMLYRIHKQPKVWHVAVIGLCLAHSLMWEPRLDFVMTIVFTAGVYAAARGLLRPLQNPALVFLGLISYSLYLTHQNIGYVVIRAVESKGGSPNVAIAAATVLALLIATALTFCIERPALQFLRPKKA